MNSLRLLEYRGDRAFAHEVLVEFVDKRIFFHELPFIFKDEIKAMRSARWHGHIPGDGRKIWSVMDCARNRLQLSYLTGENDFYSWFRRPLVHHQYRDYMLGGRHCMPHPHQFDMADSVLTYHFQTLAAEMGTGKTLSAQMIIEHGEAKYWWWVGPKATIDNIKREFDRWGFRNEQRLEFITYEGLVSRMAFWQSTDELPQGIIFDEASKLKTATSKRTVAAQTVSDMIREQYGTSGYVVPMSGTPAPHGPIDVWSLAEITYPGYLREASPATLEKRLANMTLKKFEDGSFWSRDSWKEDEIHQLSERLKGLFVVKHAKDCLTLPEVRFERIECTPAPSMLRLARAIANSSDNAMTAMTQLRELSDGFQYREVQDGTRPCAACTRGRVLAYVEAGTDHYADCSICNGTGLAPNIVRKTIEVPSTKEKALSNLLDLFDETGRTVIFAGYTGSVDRCVKACAKKGWHVVRCDGRGFVTLDPSLNELPDKPLDFWSDLDNTKVAYVAQADSGAFSFTFTESRSVVFYSISFKPESYTQGIARVQRQGTRGCTVYNLCCLPSDDRALSLVNENRRLELMTIGDAIGDCFSTAA